MVAPPNKPLTPGVLHHHLRCDRLEGLLAERICATLTGARGAGPPAAHGQRAGEPLSGLLLTVDCARALPTTGRVGGRPAKGRATRERRLLAPFEKLPDNDYGHGILALHVLATLLASTYEPAATLPLFLCAQQDYRRGYACQQVRRLERDPALGPAFLEHLKNKYRYDLTDKPVTHQHRDHRAEPAAQIVWAATRADSVSLPTRTGPPPPLFGEADEDGR